MLKENGYQESIISKIFKRITNNHSLPQSQKITQATDMQEEKIRMSINLPYVEGTCEKLRRILRSHKIRSTFYTEKTLQKLFRTPKDRVATEDKNNIVYEIDCSNCVRMKLLNTAGKHITTLTGIRRKLLMGKAG